MSREHFSYQQTNTIHASIERICHKGFSRRQVFEDWLEMIVCALSGGRMEARYLEIVKPYSEGDKGERPIDILAGMFGDLVNAMEDTKHDILGDYFMGAVTFGEHGQYYSPESITDMMAKMTQDKGETGKLVSDPCCGSGRMLLSSAKVNPRNTFIGQDLDLRCVRMAAINLALYGLRGYVIWGNSLTFEERLTYRIGFDGQGVIAVVEPQAVPEPEQETMRQFPLQGEQFTMFDAA